MAAQIMIGFEFQVNTNSRYSQENPSVTVLTDGGFVVTWDSQDGSGRGVYGQRYGADGIAQGSEFRINSTTMYSQFDPSVSAYRMHTSFFPSTKHASLRQFLVLIPSR